jgi:hypothetical protein
MRFWPKQYHGPYVRTAKVVCNIIKVRFEDRQKHAVPGNIRARRSLLCYCKIRGGYAMESDIIIYNRNEEQGGLV